MNYLSNKTGENIHEDGTAHISVKKIFMFDFFKNSLISFKYYIM